MGSWETEQRGFRDHSISGANLMGVCDGSIWGQDEVVVGCQVPSLPGSVPSTLSPGNSPISLYLLNPRATWA